MNDNNSFQAFKSSVRQLHLRERIIYDHLLSHPVGATDRDIKAGLGFDDMNMVRPRITGLIALGLVRKTGNTKCPVTGHLVRIVRAVRVAIQPELSNS